MSDTLNSDQQLGFEQEVVSNSGACKVRFQDDGNLVLYRLTPPIQGGTWKPIWASNTVGTDASFCVMQSDGNLVIYNPAMQPKWASNTAGSGATFAVIQDDENFVVYRPDLSSPWASNTSNPSPFVPPSCDAMKANLQQRKNHLEFLDSDPHPDDPSWKADRSATLKEIEGYRSLIAIRNC